MGWFDKKTKNPGNEKNEVSLLPKLPELPKLNRSDELLPPLPALPVNSPWEKEGEGVFDENNLEQENELPKIQKPLKKFPEKISHPGNFPIHKIKEISTRIQEAEPVFVRLDKFEESLKIFEKTKSKVAEVEKKLNDTKRIKEEEEKELELWENEINMIKEQLEKIDENIFSKIK